jgi:catechol 2,3-dioxygenase-like lactoylglutathione lyase family enzyme
MIQAKRFSHAAFETPDLERQIDYFTQVVGLAVAARENGRAHLATKVGDLVVQLDKGDQARCTKLAFQVDPDTEFGDIRKGLEAEGVRCESRNDTAPGIPKTVTFEDPKGTKIDVFAEQSPIAKNQQVAGIGPLKLGHVAFYTPDIQRTVAFYEKVLGFRVSDWIGDFFCFMRCNSDHHTVNFFTGPNAKLHHIAFELKDFMHLQNSCELMGQKQVPIIWGPLRHGPGHNIATYHRNQDEQVVEFFCELDKMTDEELGYFEPRPWHHDTPQRPKLWTPGKTTVWGPTPEDDFHRTQV